LETTRIRLTADGAANRDELLRADEWLAVAQTLRARAESAFAIARVGLDSEATRWFVPPDIAAPPSTVRVTTQTDFTHHDVDRVLSDL
jgi:hypothetical protein